MGSFIESIKEAGKAPRGGPRGGPRGPKVTTGKASPAGAFVSELAERLGSAGLSSEELQGMSSHKGNPLDYLKDSAFQQQPPAPAAVTPPPATPNVVGPETAWYKRNPEGALLGLAGAGALGGAGLYGLYHLYANKKLKEKEQQKAGLNPGLLKAAMTAMAAPTAPSAAAPLPKPQMSGAMQSNVPNAPQQAASSTSQPTTSQQPQQTLAPTWRQTASDQVAQGSGAQQQGQEQQGGGQSQGQQ